MEANRRDLIAQLQEILPNWITDIPLHFSSNQPIHTKTPGS